ncbi:hypothetical protein [Oribacterium sinus]|uniref:hypothetical protein n=1 Tax=Oribacterium sinus TaxID=237576 RepID=UPI0028E76261|nr:hypothetical protein [Oribacterium sinus]
MKINMNTTYCIIVDQENPDQKKHKIISENEKFCFTGAELTNAIITAGMPDVYLRKENSVSRKNQIKFKTYLIETFLKEVEIDSEHYLAFNHSQKIFLDSTEVGAINYWIGMVFITLRAKKKYKYDYLVHLSMIKEFSHTIKLNSKVYITPKGRESSLSPDLVAVKAIDKNDFKYGIFESKGYYEYSSVAMEHGWEQAKSVKYINSKEPSHTFVAMTETGGNCIRMIEKDPVSEDGEIDINIKLIFLYHFIPIVELVRELQADEVALLKTHQNIGVQTISRDVDGKESIEVQFNQNIDRTNILDQKQPSNVKINLTSGIFRNGQDSYEISIPSDIYNYIIALLNKIDTIDRNEEFEKFIEKQISSEEISNLVSYNYMKQGMKVNHVDLKLDNHFM